MERKIALAQHLGLEVFQFNGTYYTGATIQDFKAYSTIHQLREDIDTTNEHFIDWLNENCSELDLEINEDYGENTFGYNGEDYLVVTDDEADALWEDDLDNYIEECILHELPAQYKPYFDNKAWKNDARDDGRAHSLSRYDGKEDTETIDNETYYIYRVN